jgi:hypothetical protein
MLKESHETGIVGGDDGLMLNKYRQALIEMMVMQKESPKPAPTAETMV